MKKKSMILIACMAMVLGSLAFWVTSNKDKILAALPNSTSINGITVPVDPGSATNKTVAGVDSDKNGIRDEIDRYIAMTYGTKQNQFAAMQISARAYQRQLLVDPTDKKAALAAMESSADAGICAGEKFLADGIAAPGKYLNEMYLLSFNTPERIAQRKAVAAAAGQFTRSVTDAVCK